MNIGRPNFTHDYLLTRGRCEVAAAIIGAGALGAGATIWGANKAAGAQTAASSNAINLQKMMFGIGREAVSPFIDAGAGTLETLKKFIDPSNPLFQQIKGMVSDDAGSPLSRMMALSDTRDQNSPLTRLLQMGNTGDSNSPLSALLRLTTPGANMSETLEQTPGFQFTRDMGLKAVGNRLAARGLGGPGGAMARGAADYTTGLASNTWQSVVEALRNSLTSGAGVLGNALTSGTSAIGSGLTSGAGILQNLFSSGSNALANLVSGGANAAGSLLGGANTAGGLIGNNMVGIGNANAGAATATGGALAGLGNTVTTAMLMQRLMGGSGGINVGGFPFAGGFGLNPAPGGGGIYSNG